jgi:hypothetical protein
MKAANRTTTDIAQIKRRLLKAIQELESINYIRTLPPLERFTKNSAGTWEVHFEKNLLPSEESEQGALMIEIEELTPLEGRLIGHGVSKSQARKLVSEYDDTRIEALEFLLLKGGEVVPTNRGGGSSKPLRKTTRHPEASNRALNWLMKIGRRPRRRGKDKKRFAEEKLKRKQMKPGRMPIGKITRSGSGIPRIP